MVVGRSACQPVNTNAATVLKIMATGSPKRTSHFLPGAGTFEVSVPSESRVGEVG